MSDEGSRHLWWRLPMSIAGVLLCGGAAIAQMSHDHPSKTKPDCADARLACATKATPTFAPDGTLWLAWDAGGKVSVAHSSDLAAPSHRLRRSIQSRLISTGGPTPVRISRSTRMGAYSWPLRVSRIASSTDKCSTRTRPMVDTRLHHLLRSQRIWKVSDSRGLRLTRMVHCSSLGSTSAIEFLRKRETKSTSAQDSHSLG